MGREIRVPRLTKGSRSRQDNQCAMTLCQSTKDVNTTRTKPKYAHDSLVLVEIKPVAQVGAPSVQICTLASPTTTGVRHTHAHAESASLESFQPSFQGTSFFVQASNGPAILAPQHNYDACLWRTNTEMSEGAWVGCAGC